MNIFCRAGKKLSEMCSRRIKIFVFSAKKFSYEKFYEKSLFQKKLHTSTALSAGHSKWANIRHIKAQKDGQKSTLFTRFARQIRLAVQEGGSADPALNSILRNVVDDALRKNMPMASIQNSLKKYIQNKGLLKKHFLYWRFRNKVFAVCTLYTDSFAQFKMDLAPVLRKFGAVYVDAQYIFDDVGVIETIVSDEIKSKVKTEDDLEQICTEDGIECGVEDVEVIHSRNGTVNFMCHPMELGTISRMLKTKGYLIESSEHVFTPKTTVKLSDEDLEIYQVFLKQVRDIPGVDAIYDNFEI